MTASLMMYARPELEEAHARYWHLIRDSLAKRKISAPLILSNAADEFGVWTSPDLVLSQTCGMPYRQRLHDRVNLIGTPDFGLDECPPGYYRSAIVVRADDARRELSEFSDATFAYNQTISQSGYAAAYAAARNSGFWFENRVQSHGHILSAQMISQGQADIASIDAVTWRLIERYDNFANDLKVLTWTDPTPGLPYITAKGAKVKKIHDAVAEAIQSLTNDDRAALGLVGLIRIPKAEYLAIKSPPEGA